MSLSAGHLIPPLGGAAALALISWSLASKEDPVVRYTARTAGVLLLYGALVVGLESPSRMWCWVFAVVPAVLIAQQMLYLSLVRRPFERGLASRSENDLVARMHLVRYGAGDARTSGIVEAARQAADDSDRYFSPSAIWLRLGLPAIFLVVLLGVVLCAISESDLSGKLPSLYHQPVADSLANILPRVLRGLRYGAAGAYVFVVLHLAVRNFRHDITNGAAVWCVATVAIGPLLAAVVSLIWTDPQKTPWTEAGAYFFAGLSPRLVTDGIAEAFRRILRPGSDANAGATRLLPLTNLRGITTGIAERLGEDGVDDAYSLAMAEPLRLIRSTYFDVRQIVGWMDEALLLTWLPTAWQKLEEVGITGAIDLAWHAGDPAQLKALSEKIGMEVGALTSVARRLLEDRQVQILWVLYQTERRDGGSTRSDPPQAQPIDRPGNGAGPNQPPPPGSQ